MIILDITKYKEEIVKKRAKKCFLFIKKLIKNMFFLYKQLFIYTFVHIKKSQSIEKHVLNGLAKF